MRNKPKKSSTTGVGYKKPPLHTRFQKGRSGNPRGRPPGSPNLTTALKRTLGEPVIVNENGERRSISKLEAAVKQMVHKAVAGDTRAMQQVMGVMRVIEAESPPATAPEAAPTDTDRQIMQEFLRRRRRVKEGDDDGHHDPE